MTDLQPPASLPNYLADGLPKQDVQTLEDVHRFVEALLDERQRPIASTELPADAETIAETAGQGTVVEERVKCGAQCTCNDGAAYLYAYRRTADDSLTSEYLGKPRK